MVWPGGLLWLQGWSGRVRGCGCGPGGAGWGRVGGWSGGGRPGGVAGGQVWALAVNVYTALKGVCSGT